MIGFRTSAQAFLLATIALLFGGIASAQDRGYLEEGVSNDDVSQICELPQPYEATSTARDSQNDARAAMGDPSFLKLCKTIGLDAELSEEELGVHEGHLRQYHEWGGDHSRMRKLAKLARLLRCNSDCMAVSLMFISKAHAIGVGHRKATTMSIRAFQDELRSRRRSKLKITAGQLRERLRTRLETRLRDWQHTRLVAGKHRRLGVVNRK